MLSGIIGRVIDSDVWHRVVEFAGERGRPGTAFLAGDGQDQLLVTARHLCTDDPDEILTLRHPWTNDGYGYQVAASRVGMDTAPTADFAIFRLERPILEVGNDIPLASEDFVFSQFAYILGYPFELSLRLGSSHPQRLPIVKSCIIGGADTDDNGVDLLYIDTLVNPGFSGGPLVYREPETQQKRFAGVVAKSMFAPIREPTSEEPEPPMAPAGIGVVVRETNIRRAIQQP